MSTTTDKLGLIKPDIEDFGAQFVQDLASNFQKLDDSCSALGTGEPVSGYWKAGSKVDFINPVANGYVGLVNLRSGMTAPKWSALKQFNVGDLILPTANNGHYYTCTQSGTSAPLEPQWLVAAQTVTEDTRGKATWQPSRSYALHDVVVPSIPNDRFYVCVTAGTSGTGEPTWSTTNGVATTDGQVVWMTYRIVKWRETGTSVNFRPYGKIE